MALGQENRRALRLGSLSWRPLSRLEGVYQPLRADEAVIEKSFVAPAHSSYWPLADNRSAAKFCRPLYNSSQRVEYISGKSSSSSGL